MRLDRLDLVRYGKFTDASLALGSDGQADLHIVFGNNEAGKTTTLNAFLDLVFGIDPSTPYRFLHEASALRVGGVLEVDGEKRSVIRLPKTALLDSDERPLPQGLFNQELAGLDRATYKTMFSLDEKTLEAGGESILASQGDLGHLLFSATAGLSDFTRALATLKDEADNFYRLHGRKHELADFKRQLAVMKERRAAIDVTAAPFARLIATRDAARTDYEATLSERGRLQGELEESRRLLVTLPRLTEWTRLKADYDALPEVPPVPQDWPGELADLQKTEVALAARQASAAEEIERLTADIAALPIDEAALSVVVQGKTLADLRARDATAAKDLPDRRAALRAAENAVSNILRDLGQAECATPGKLLLRPGVVHRLRQCLESLSGTSAAEREAASELASAEAREQEARAALAAMSVLTDDDSRLIDLKQALAAAEADDSTARLRLAERNCRTHADVLAEQLAALAPWQGDGSALSRLDVPERSERDRLERAIQDSEKRLADRAAEVGRHEDEIRRLERLREALSIDHAAIGDEAAAASRSTRDAAWRSHLSTLDGKSAKIFEDTLRADDAIVGARFLHTAAISELRTLNRNLIATAADLESAQRHRDAAEIAYQGTKERAAALASRFVGTASEAPLAALAAFLVKRERALETHERQREAEADRRYAAAAMEEMSERLGAALKAVQAALPQARTIQALISTGRAFLECQNLSRAARARGDNAAREVSDRQKRAARAAEDMRLWREEWTQTLHSTWLVDTPEINDVRDALASLANLASALEARDGLADRVAKMEADRATFSAEVRRTALALGIFEDGDVGKLADLIESRIRRASGDTALRSVKSEDCRSAETRLRQMRPEIESTQTRIAEMTSRFGVPGLDDLALVFDAARRRADLGDRIRALEIDICSACNVAVVEEARAALASLDRNALERRRAELEARSEDQVTRSQQAFAALRSASDAVDAVDGDAAAARLEEEKRTLLLEIEERTMAHLALRAGIIAAEGAITLYRDRHRSSMMKQASELFTRLTRGAYTGLAAQSLKDKEILVGLSASGGSKLSTQMSTATRSQLYLALRIAAYREFVKTRLPVPFVLDDVLETFDDDRAEASLSLLADLAKTGQVIYLTHHSHLCAIARRVCPEAKLHDLGAI